jgi:hypothetical protein
MKPIIIAMIALVVGQYTLLQEQKLGSLDYNKYHLSSKK